MCVRSYKHLAPLERKQNGWPPRPKTNSNAIHAPMIQAEFSANAEKAAGAKTKLPVTPRELQLALSVQTVKSRTKSKTT